MKNISLFIGVFFFFGCSLSAPTNTPLPSPNSLTENTPSPSSIPRSYEETMKILQDGITEIMTTDAHEYIPANGKWFAYDFGFVDGEHVYANFEDGHMAYQALFECPTDIEECTLLGIFDEHDHKKILQGLNPYEGKPLVFSTPGFKTGAEEHEMRLQGFSFSFPARLLAKTEDEKSVHITHTHEFVHPDFCNLRDASPIPLFTDFDMTVTLEDGDREKNISEEWGENEKGTSVIIGGKEGKMVSAGVEGCGVTMYYFSDPSQKKTLVVRNMHIGELSDINGEKATYEAIPGVILPEENTKFGEEIMSSVQFQ